MSWFHAQRSFFSHFPFLPNGINVNRCVSLVSFLFSFFRIKADKSGKNAKTPKTQRVLSRGAILLSHLMLSKKTRWKTMGFDQRCC